MAFIINTNTRTLSLPLSLSLSLCIRTCVVDTALHLQAPHAVVSFATQVAAVVEEEDMEVVVHRATPIAMAALAVAAAAVFGQG